MTNAAYRDGFSMIDWTVPLPAPVRSVSISPARSNLPCPQIRPDGIKATRSMADNQIHDSRSGLYRSYRADGNPQGVDYEIQGNEQKPDIAKSGTVDMKAEKAKRRESVERAKAKISRGEGVKLPE